MTDSTPIVPENDRENRLRTRLASALADANHVDLLAVHLRRVREADQITAEQLASCLNTRLDALDRLSLCRPPRDEHFVQDTAQIAAHCGCDPSALVSLLRRAQVLTTFAEPAPQDLDIAASRPKTVRQPRRGFLLAARDMEDSTTEQNEDAPHE